MGLFSYLIASILHNREAEHDAETENLPQQRIVILGGGFGGVYTAKRLGQIFARDPNVEVVLVSESNYLLFTPMLAEVAAGSLQPQHISVPIRSAAPLARLEFASVESVDTDSKTVQVRDIATGEEKHLLYDQLVLALGSRPNYFGLHGIEEHALTLKTLNDAANLREHVLRLLAIADQEPDQELRRQLLSFVVIGGGFAGSETIAEVHDLVNSVLRFHPNLSLDEPRFTLITHGTDSCLS